MLVSSIVTQIANAVGDSGAVYSKSDLIVDYINEAIRDIYLNSSVGYQKSYSTTMDSGDTAITVDPSVVDYLKVHRVIVDGTRTLQEADQNNLIDWYGYTYLTTTGSPEYYWRELTSGRNALVLAPPPNNTITVVTFYTPYPTVLISSQDTSLVIPEQFVDDIVRFGVVRAKERMGDYQGAQHATLQYAGGIAKRADATQKMQDTFTSISPDPLDYF
jgi:hypothetical protein